ncbi:hypothetical protein EYM_02195 [Ignicoccus islandicus DSM 13165]|uniref:Uncharacterized protein n=1 Tax=Ignicoccus islandicus DSM 13165 TaxID=940295 RepID=A0A0U3DXS1_9CREN|nr:hypothetical protein [Ignicoccus islandicus]ALU12298.1 hypothetical protein EYM_02195 [Ignicoccus islandicus DSM 13165]
MGYDPLLVIVLSLITLMVVTSIMFKMNVVLSAGIGSVSAAVGGLGSYLICTILFPSTSPIICATIGSISSMWSSVLTLYLSASLQQQGIGLTMYIHG